MAKFTWHHRTTTPQDNLQNTQENQIKMTQDLLLLLLLISMSYDSIPSGITKKYPC